MLRTPLGKWAPLSFGVSAAVHATLFFATAGDHGVSPRIAEDTSVSVDVLSDPLAVPSDPASREDEPAGAARATERAAPMPSRAPVAAHDQVGLPRRGATATVPSAEAEGANDDAPRFTIAIGAAPTDTFAASSPIEKAGGASPLPENMVDGQARLLRGLAPDYPEGARETGVEGEVRLELIVGVGGEVESARVTHSIARSVDESALRAVRQFRFAPATKGGRPVRVRMGWGITFHLL